MKHYILFIDDNDRLRESMQRFFDREGFVGKCVATGAEGIALVRQKIFPFSIALVDYHLGDMNGAQVIARLRELDSDLVAIGFSDDKSDPVHNLALDAGAISFINKDAGDAKLLGILHRHCREYERRKKPLTITTRTANQKLIEILEMAGCSNHMAENAKLVLKFAESMFTVLIRGEPGTGKEKIARAIHNNSRRRLMPYIAVNCAAFSKNLIATELFGHEKGSFTGATHDKAGKFQAANGGTIFLDEIGELDQDVQAVLLRVLQEKTFIPVGSNITKKVDVRVIAATNAPLEDLIHKKLFRQDLFFRLNVLPIHLKPLRERPEDIPYLIEYFMAKMNKDAKHKKIILEADVEHFKRMPWLGNVRDLEHALEYLMIVSDGNELDVSLLKNRTPPDVRPIAKSRPHADFDAVIADTDRVEHDAIVAALKHHGSVASASRGLGLSRSTLRDKIKRLGIEIEKPKKEEIDL
jgi:DNA-binding NtrC family response regulator